MYYNYCIKSLSNFTMRQHEVVTDEFLPRKQNEARCGAICLCVRARCSGTANWGAFSGARRIWAGVHLLVDCLLPEKEPTHPYIPSKHTKQQPHFCNPLTSNTLPAGLGTNCKSYKPGWKITKMSENVYWEGGSTLWPNPSLHSEKLATSSMSYDCVQVYFFQERNFMKTLWCAMFYHHIHLTIPTPFQIWLLSF